MKSILSVFIVLITLAGAVPTYGQERRFARRGDGAGYSTRDANVLSMMGWGVGLAVGIALLCGYMEQSGSNAHSSSGSSGTSTH